MLREKTIWGVVPEGFRTFTDERGARLVVREDRLAEIGFAVCRFDQLGDREFRYQGRSPLEAVRLSDGNTALVRRYRHGGWLRGLTRGCFFSWPPRPFRELAITEELRRRGLRTVEVYAAFVERILGPFYHGCLVTRELRDAKDLWAALQAGLICGGRKGAVLKAIAETVRAMHVEGVYHSDLNLKNILVRFSPGGVEGYIIDFDRARLFLGKLPPPLVKKNLNRLHRSALKLDPERRYFTAACWKEFLDYYHGSAE